jgi:hypothetical protein
MVRAIATVDHIGRTGAAEAEQVAVAAEAIEDVGLRDAVDVAHERIAVRVAIDDRHGDGSLCFG